jgi:hypothetical protein
LDVAQHKRGVAQMAFHAGGSSRVPCGRSRRRRRPRR